MNLNLTLIGQAIAFAVFVWFCMKFVWPPVMQALQERQKKIADGLDAASRATRDLELAQEQAAEQLKESKEQAAQIIEQAHKRANQMIEEARDNARLEGERMIESARGEIEQETQRAKEELRTQVAALAIQGAERILDSSIDEAKHRELVDKLAAEL
ncbi:MULTISPECIES: F0F1 ATP synthase subunit B [Chromohalobacter]|uniref:ATP synthase subunit b n=1 Tax=Chromohalobacter israelensis (strain ATCC BAA-138 / DSM 3043 / CIP 106854 / NCIMB 13768 / 1H11) TaxID=290398 RepID=ATPF_CHRI1|nr:MULTISPECIES: F0F1 ATP synthase subunit B [Chromohalobacter]Q1QSC6.1 RecName: Full=ATP synthase subunit b; AltName: Full=ATP synthase F(0) sector subunit b; AltName: Full=ATPase subunit I; AltName: Full=F-type ATPase subunit b; Short=F-ATPase subunit b [Chromohalobacter salexigens DSM 3043]ABE60632.1 ATP synthase F0 subcomplex B subunit [Chromohalobacter salexigens DSM 3043]MBZ5875170.1 F0F1 ATP synthase subunit B [Chromohalobacter salexigens]MDF9433907.1 F0F1 ATP synthase subunit B [Chromoh